MTTGAEIQKQAAGYKQATKVVARELALKHAVDLLTVRREAAAIVSADHVAKVKNKLIGSADAGDRSAGEQCTPSDIASWRAFRAVSIGTRDPTELTVAYLAGPEPSNDLTALISLGLRPENIWAFEVDPTAVASGVVDLAELGLRGVKFIPVSIDEYFVGTPRRFDIVYIDACGPLPSDQQKTTRLIVDIFKHGALAPLGVLITNFSKPDISKVHTRDTYSALVAAYLFPKGFVEGDAGRMVEGPPVHSYLLQNPKDPEKCFLTRVKGEFEDFYGQFITRHIFDIAEIIAPTVRLTNSKLYQVLFEADLQKAAERGRRFAKFNPHAFDNADDEDTVSAGPPDVANAIDSDGDANLEPEMFSLIWTLAACGFYDVDENFEAPDEGTKKFVSRWKNQLTGAQTAQRSAEDLIATFYAWRSDQSLWSNAMKRVGAFPYRSVMPFLCDVPTEEIGFYPAFAQLAYPAHGNIREAKRYRYVAEGKNTPMLMDVIAFDECRYVYDWLSALHHVPDNWFDLSAQLTFRFALDGIAKMRRWFGDDFLYGCHVVGVDSDFPAAEIAPRSDLSSS